MAGDFREYYHLSFSEIGDSITWEEGCALHEDLKTLMGSRLHKKYHNWDFRADMQTIRLTNLVNVTAQAHSRKKLRSSELLPMPWKSTKKIGKVLPLKDAYRFFKAANPAMGDL